jgi:hypothetical protein
MTPDTTTQLQEGDMTAWSLKGRHILLALALCGCAGGEVRGGPPPTWRAEIEMSIGGDSGDDRGVTFGSISGLAFGPAGQLVVADRQDQVIRVFGPDGRALDAAGRRGQGPGDLADRVASPLSATRCGSGRSRTTDTPPSSSAIRVPRSFGPCSVRLAAWSLRIASTLIRPID